MQGTGIVGEDCELMRHTEGLGWPRASGASFLSDPNVAKGGCGKEIRVKLSFLLPGPGWA